jgi:hypothetical protein
MQENLIRWLAGGQRGVSSNTMVQHLTGLPALRDFHGDHPHDPDDMTRCRRLLEEVPELQAEFPRMATYSGPWAKLVEHWQELCGLMDTESPRWREGVGRAPKTYKRMRELIDAGRLDDGWTQPSPGYWRGPQKQQETTIGRMTIATR